MLLCKTQLGELLQKAALKTETIWCFSPYSCGQLSTLQVRAAVKKSELEMTTGTRSPRGTEPISNCTTKVPFFFFLLVGQKADFQSAWRWVDISIRNTLLALQLKCI